MAEQLRDGFMRLKEKTAIITGAGKGIGRASASKWGQIGFTKSAAEEGKSAHIRVNAIAPGKVDTPMRALVSEDKDKMLKAEDCVGPAIFLAYDDARFVTGQVIEIEWFGE